MQIGFVQRKTYPYTDSDGIPTVAHWLEMTIRIPGLTEMKFKLTKGKQEQGKKMPDTVLFYRMNQRKGEKYRDVQAGALWQSVSTDGKTNYLSGYIESPALPSSRIRIALFKATPRFENESVQWEYDVVWSNKEAKQAQTQQQEPYYEDNLLPTDLYDDEVPF
jgi:uncharacterized protein (DUF736 family)